MQELSLSGRTVLMRIMLRAAELLWVNLSLPTETATASNIHFSVHETFQCHLMASHAQLCPMHLPQELGAVAETGLTSSQQCFTAQGGFLDVFFFTNHNGLQLFQFFLQSHHREQSPAAFAPVQSEGCPMAQESQTALVQCPPLWPCSVGP